jgi:hypothetical protein
MMDGTTRALLVTALLVPALSAAQDEPRPTQPAFGYSYVEIGYDETEFDIGSGREADADGLTLSGSYELTDEWHLYTAYGSIDLDDFNADVDTFVVGAGYVFPLKDDIDLYGRVLYIDQEVDSNFGNVDDDGLGLQFRIRARITDEFEFEGGVQYVDVADSDTSLLVSGRYHFTDAFSAGIGLTFGGDVDGIGVNARFTF